MRGGVDLGVLPSEGMQGCLSAQGLQQPWALSATIYADTEPRMMSWRAHSYIAWPEAWLMYVSGRSACSGIDAALSLLIRLLRLRKSHL